MDLQIIALPAFNDNYIWLLQLGNKAAVVDPGDAAPVKDYLAQHNLTLTTILLTHHHHDHIGGVAELVKLYQPKVYGPGTISVVTHPVADGEQLELSDFNLNLTITAIPGHTLDHIMYYDAQHVWCGDTLFLAGCGRLFEGTAEQMYQSLQKINQLPADTQVFCAHEYTLANLNFALAVEPNNTAIQKRIEAVKTLRNQNRVTIPASLNIERETNPFLRCEQPVVIKAAQQNSGQPCPTPVSVFAAIRTWKDNF